MVADIIPLQVGNGTTTVIIQSDPSTLGVFIATAILAAATSLGRIDVAKYHFF